jgi:hypothetical protein
MFDVMQRRPKDRPSVVEERLRAWVDRQPAGPVFVVDFPRHGRRTSAPPVGEETLDAAASRRPTGPAEPVEPETAHLAGLLEAGAHHLSTARAAHLVQCREAAVQARALAAFAACRPAAVLDRPDAEVGAAAAASRAARPAVLTAVSEWAVDEVMVAFGLSSAAASRLLTESVILAQRLPATLDALEGGVISWAHARMLTEVLAPLADDAVRAEVEARLLARAAAGRWAN